MSFEIRLRTLRESCNLSMEQVSDKLRIPLTEYEEYEYGKDMPAEILKRLVALYGVSADSLLSLPTTKEDVT